MKTDPPQNLHRTRPAANAKNETNVQEEDR